MKKTALSIIAMMTMGQIVYAGGDIAPVEPVVGPVVEEVSGWQQELTIYGWLAGIDGAVELPFGSVSSSVETSDIIENLKMVLMGTYAARYDKWSFYGDLVYMNVGDSQSQTLPLPNNPTATVDLDIKTMLINAGIGYNIIESGQGILDIAAGVRYMDLEVDVGTNLSRHPGDTASDDLVDFVVGVKGYYNINSNWYIPYAADIGAGDSELTWQVFAGIGYRYDWGDVKFGYRHIDYNFEDEMFMEDLAISGAVLGATFKF
ncbi:MAG: hypothetical protein U9Q90_09765 [Campylobacterota bacterium]|nr:hypothetical protein [Campylobacterota bacterium]